MVNTDDRSRVRLANETTHNADDSFDLLSNKSIELNFVRNKLQKFQNNILNDVEKRMSGMIDEVLREIRQHELQNSEFKNFAMPTLEENLTASNNTWSNRMGAVETEINEINKTVESTDANSEKSTKIKRALPDKMFTTRESYLTALLKVEHMNVIYNIFYVIILLSFANGICCDYFIQGRAHFGLGTFKTGLAKLHLVLGTLVVMNLFVFSIYYALKGWALLRHKLQGASRSLWNYLCLLAYISSQLLFGAIAATLCIKLDLPFVSASVLLLECTRLLMKMHAYVRSNVPRLLQGKLKTQDEKPATLAPFSSYLYFLFAPTLLYRDNYPRTAEIRWKYAATRLLEVVAIAFLYSYIHERHIRENFAQISQSDMNLYSFLVKLSSMMMPAMIIFLCGFYLILHAWLNFTSELLRFGDRMFYKDWWTSNTYDAYYRNWNVVVHDWLYEFIYKDFYNIIFKGSKAAASMMVFFISAVVHEWIMGFALQLFCPIMFFFFWIVGMPMVFLTRKLPKSVGNIFLWFTLIIGNGLMVSLYCMEYYARQNCAKSYENWWDYLTPGLWSCYKN